VSLFDTYNPFAQVVGARAYKTVPKPAAAKSVKGDSLLGYLQQAGFKGPALRTAWAIAKRESGGRPEAYNPNRGTGDDSYGLFQINMLGDLGPARRRQYGLQSNEDLYDPQTNARVAFQMSKGGTDFGAWGVGPNAYRKTAPLSFAGYPGAQVAKPQAVRPAARAELQQAPDMSFEPNPFTGVVGGDNPFAAVFAGRPANPFAPPPRASATPVPLNLPKGVVDTSRWTPSGTHVTSGLDLNKGRKTAVDIMAKPGTAVAAPANGVVVRLGSAQGGDSMYFRDDQGHTWWLGHVDSRYSLAPGTRVRAGQTLTRISADHPAPHLHLDRSL
jgi:murein DD-endopeptidase MepM/ murein hydrolase activator NlpD